ncbi:aminopeptidase N-like isoform X1 [Denticeps clupeoides]|uniref:aminopeptidase N-like isoform X1 n=1 Tax=Denticeps clupeoides TaxID=299321 RepID=UPI0010A358B2|nr:aminopeptidase N-like isoform X1 [Denticeps clupeoides]
MAKGFYIHKNVAITVVLLGGTAVATIIALSVILSHERSKNQVKPTMNDTTPSTLMPSTPTPSNEPWDRYRLPDSLLPEYYNVTLWPRLHVDEHGMYIFTGNSTVVFRCVKETDLVLIHSDKLNFTTYSGHHAILSAVDGPSPPAIKTTWLQVRTQYLVVQLNGNLVPGKSYQLFTEFRGELADDLEGLYRSEYMEDGVKKVVATTQMQATYARKAFPCFDEPAMKAVFHITILHDKGTVALANGRDVENVTLTVEGTEVTRTTFEPTKRMSTYVLAFIVSDFDFIEAPETSSGTMVRIWARKKAIESGQGGYALNVTLPILEFFETYYNTSYPLSKSDQVALPDFNAGAMENWGLVTYRETALLYDPDKSSNGNKERVLTVISHELAHMWFGNLVTLRWWNDLWLNEGFASYVEYLGADYAEPTWNIREQIVRMDVQRVFSVDALASSHPLSVSEDEVNRPEEISEMFDTISYSKGAAVLRMLSEFLTEPVFATGLSSYLHQFAFSNTVYSDLWDHLQKAAETHGRSLPDRVHDIMNRWILQMGFPVVTINTQRGKITQQHFLLDPDTVVHRTSPFNYEWFVPIKWMKNDANEQSLLWLLNKESAYPQIVTSGTEWVLANLNVSGYYRVNYDLENWERLFTQLDQNHEAIPVLNRAQLIDDAFNLARAAMLNITFTLRSTKYLVREKEYIPWQSATGNLYNFMIMFDRTEVYGPMQAYLRKLVLPLFEYFRNITLNWTRQPPLHNDQYSQNIAISLACSTDVVQCKTLTLGWYREWMRDPYRNPIHPNLRSTAYCQAIAAGDVEEWDFGWEMLKKATIASEAARLRSALACTKKPWLLNRYLQYSLDPSKIRKQDATSTIGYIANNVVGQSFAWDFFRARWDLIFEQYGKSSFTLSSLIGDVTRRFSTEFELKQLREFKESHPDLGSGKMAVERAIEKTVANIKWMAENKQNLLDWFLSESSKAL